jgi:hypothetical protein
MQLPEPPKFPPNAHALYNALMARIEPELVMENVPKAKEKYANETPEQREERRKRYTAAFKEYYKQMEEYFRTLRKSLKDYERNVIKAVEKGSKEEEENTFFADFDSAVEAASAS